MNQDIINKISNKIRMFVRILTEQARDPSMPIELLNDPLIHFKITTMKSENLLAKEQSQFDAMKIHEALDKISKRLDAIEKKLESDTEEEEDEYLVESKYESNEKKELAPATKKKKEKVEKSLVVFDIMPLEATTNFEELIALIKKIKLQGLEWGEFSLEDFCYGIKKLRVACLLENEITSTDQIEELILDLDAYVQTTPFETYSKSLFLYKLNDQ
ncbi:hypothetical protein MXB_1183, partial [Myxobolus squamalis]